MSETVYVSATGSGTANYQYATAYATLGQGVNGYRSRLSVDLSAYAHRRITDLRLVMNASSNTTIAQTIRVRVHASDAWNGDSGYTASATATAVSESNRVKVWDLTALARAMQAFSGVFYLHLCESVSTAQISYIGGQTSQTRPFFRIESIARCPLYRFDGEVWQRGSLYRYDGSAWTSGSLARTDGTSWR